MGLDGAGRETKHGSYLTLGQVHEIAQGDRFPLTAGQTEKCLDEGSPEHDLVLPRRVGVCRPGLRLTSIDVRQGLMKRNPENPSVPVGQRSYPLPPGEGDGERLEGCFFRTLGAE